MSEHNETDSFRSLDFQDKAVAHADAPCSTLASARLLLTVVPNDFPALEMASGVETGKCAGQCSKYNARLYFVFVPGSPIFILYLTFIFEFNDQI